MLGFLNLVLFILLLISFGLIVMLLLLPSREEMHEKIIKEISEAIIYCESLLKHKEISLKYIFDCFTILWVLFVLIVKLGFVYVLLSIDEAPPTLSTENVTVESKKTVVPKVIRKRARKRTRVKS